jgi:hypothetical protein
VEPKSRDRHTIANDEKMICLYIHTGFETKVKFCSETWHLLSLVDLNNKNKELRLLIVIDTENMGEPMPSIAA